MAVVGFLVGFSYSNGLAKFLAGLLLVLAFGYAMSWKIGNFTDADSDRRLTVRVKLG